MFITSLQDIMNIVLPCNTITIVWIKITFFKRRVSTTLNFFRLIDQYKLSDVYVNHNCYVMCNCNVSNIDAVVLYLSEQLNNLYYTLEKLIFSVCIYIYIYIYISFVRPFFSQSEEKFVKCSHEREEGKFSDSQISLFFFNSKSSQRILLVFGFLFFHRTSFTKQSDFQSFVVHQEFAQNVQ